MHRKHFTRGRSRQFFLTFPTNILSIRLAKFSYNRLGLPAKISSVGGTVLAKYAYLSDGMKSGAYHADGSGFIYRGSLKYARHYSPALRRWLTPDPLSEKYYTSSPYAYCAGDPVNSVDPDGRIVRGATRDDIHRIIDDINEIFRDGVFDNFRPLIMPSGRNNNGRSLAKISAQSLYEAFQDVELSDDQKALVEIVVNTINSDSIHIVEYITGALISKSAENAFSDDLPDLVQGTIDVNGGLSAEILQAFYGEGATTRTYNGTYSIIQPNGYSVCRPVTLGHELFGHGRSLALGRTDPYRQHVDAIQLENLIYRVMGINHINRGNNHAQRQFIPNPSQIPSYR